MCIFFPLNSVQLTTYIKTLVWCRGTQQKESRWWTYWEEWGGGLAMRSWGWIWSWYIACKMKLSKINIFKKVRKKSSPIFVAHVISDVWPSSGAWMVFQEHHMSYLICKENWSPLSHQLCIANGSSSMYGTLCAPPLHAETVSCWSLCRSSACSHNQWEFIRACCNGRSSYCRSPVLFEKHHSLPSSPSSASHHLSAPSLRQWSLRLELRGCSIAFPFRAKHSFSLLRSVP